MVFSVKQRSFKLFGGGIELEEHLDSQIPLLLSWRRKTKQ